LPGRHDAGGNGRLVGRGKRKAFPLSRPRTVPDAAPRFHRDRFHGSRLKQERLCLAARTGLMERSAPSAGYAAHRLTGVDTSTRLRSTKPYHRSSCWTKALCQRMRVASVVRYWVGSTMNDGMPSSLL